VLPWPSKMVSFSFHRHSYLSRFGIYGGASVANRRLNLWTTRLDGQVTSVCHGPWEAAPHCYCILCTSMPSGIFNSKVPSASG
jgi:hypothetical protein